MISLCRNEKHDKEHRVLPLFIIILIPYVAGVVVGCITILYGPTISPEETKLFFQPSLQ